MKRYIEIVYDNSGSMNDRIGSLKKYEIAQELFEKAILPSIGLKGDHVVLRLLRNRCEEGRSFPETLPNQQNLMLNRIKGINHNQSTPLFYTVYDSVEACRNIRADEYLIFVLTDGDDTCGVVIEDLIDVNTLKKYVISYKVLLVQLAVQSPISRNNLTAFTNSLGGQSVSLESSESIPQMRKKLKLALNASGFTNKFPLEYCFDKLPDFDVAWEEIEEAGINFHQAMLLKEKGMLTWVPDYQTGVSKLQYAELRFLFSLRYKSGVPEDLLRTMLSQLKKPYYYSFDCIYWDFSKARWRYFVKQNNISQQPNPDAHFEDGIFDIKSNSYTENDNKTTYEDRLIYKVKKTQITLNKTWILVREEHIGDLPPPNSKVKSLKEGDRVKFI